MNLPAWKEIEDVYDHPTGAYPEFDAFCEKVAQQMTNKCPVPAVVMRSIRAGCHVGLSHGLSSLHIMDNIMDRMARVGAFPLIPELGEAMKEACNACPEPKGEIEYPLPDNPPEAYPWLISIIWTLRLHGDNPNKPGLDWDRATARILAWLVTAIMMFAANLVRTTILQTPCDCPICTQKQQNREQQSKKQVQEPAVKHPWPKEED